MKFQQTFFLVFMSLFIGACGETLQVGDKLTADERAYLRTIAAAKCTGDTNESYENFEEASNLNMLNLQRNQNWKYEYKKEGTLIETSYLYVWKVSPPNIYFRLQLIDGGTGAESNKFIRIDTTSNIDMVRAIQAKECAKTLTVSGNSSKTAKIISPRTASGAGFTETETDYRIISSYPAYFANLNTFVTKRTLDANAAVTKTDKYDYVISVNTAAVQPTSYADSSIANKSYCIVKFTAATPYNTYTFPYETDCVSAVTGPDANADAIPDFVPSTELVL